MLSWYQSLPAVSILECRLILFSIGNFHFAFKNRNHFFKSYLIKQLSFNFLFPIIRSDEPIPPLTPLSRLEWNSLLLINFWTPHWCTKNAKKFANKRKLNKYLRIILNEKKYNYLHIGYVGAHLQELSDQVMTTEETTGKKRGHTIAIIIIKEHWGVIQELPHTGHIPRPKGETE